MFDGEAADEISILFTMKDHEWALCTGGFKGVKVGHSPKPGEGIPHRRTKSYKLKRRVFDFRQKRETRRKGNSMISQENI